MPLRLFAAAPATLLTAGALAGPAAPPPALAGSSAATAATQRYTSAFDGYRAYSEQPVLPWRESNDLVGRIGGWQAYAREAQGGATAGNGAPAAPSPAASAPSVHADQKKNP